MNELYIYLKSETFINDKQYEIWLFGYQANLP